MRRLLVVNADDFGYSDERDGGMVECYRRGHISSVSLLVNGVRADNAAKLVKQYNIATGLHVNLTEGHPVGEDYLSLTKDGCFLGKFGFRQAVQQGEIDMNEVRTEIQAQIDRFRKLMGDTPYHADGHQHIHVIPGIVGVFASVLSENGVTVTRLPIERGVAKEVWDTPQQAEFMKVIVEQAAAAKEVFTAHKLWSCVGFIGLRTMGSNMTVDRVTSHLTEVYDVTSSTNRDTDTPATSPDKIMTCEWMVHPGHVTSGEGGCGEGPDEFSRSRDRQHEMKILSSSDVANLYKTLNISLTDFPGCVNK